MRKVVVHRPGGHERLKIEHHHDPVVKPGQVCVDVAAAGVNYADCVVRMGLYSSAKKYVGWPITPGFEFAGRVHSVGHGVQTVKPGDEIFGVTRFGGYASRVCVPEHQVFPRPERLDIAEAAAFPSVFLTAYYALFELAHPRPGARLLVHSAAGGVGGALVQLGKLAGCYVVGVVGASHKVHTVSAMGADKVIDKSRSPLWRAARTYAPQGYDAVFDANGVETLQGSLEHLGSPGRLVIYGFHSMLPRQGGRPKLLKLAADYLRTPRFNPLDLTQQNKSIMAFNLSYLFDRHEVLREAMKQLIQWLEQGKLSPPSVHCYPLDRVADAHRALESGQTVGKLVLTV
jgi:synaptic vesicle membrane protein VAT-1